MLDDEALYDAEYLDASAIRDEDLNSEQYELKYNRCK